MPIVGFTFTKMHVEKSETPATNVKLNTNLGIKSMGRVPLTLGAAKEDALKLGFNFTSSYEPKIGQVELEGFLIYIDSKEAMANIEKAWKKDKKLPRELNNQFLNHIHSKCAIESVTLTKDIGLPPPIPMPKLSFDEKGK